MENIEGLVRFVNGQRDRIKRIIDDNPDEERTRKTLPVVVRRFEEVTHVLGHAHLQEQELDRLRIRVAELEAVLARRKSAMETLAVSPADLEGLPPELIEQLSISQTDREEFQILGLMEEHGGTMSMDQLLIAIYKKSREILERTKLNQRLYRMISKGMLHSVPGRKGIYTIYQPEEEEQKQIAK